MVVPPLGARGEGESASGLREAVLCGVGGWRGVVVRFAALRQVKQ